MENDPEAIVNAHLADLQNLDQKERDSIAETLVSLATGSWRVNGVDSAATLAVERTTDMLQKLSDDDPTSTLKQALFNLEYEQQNEDSGAEIGFPQIK